MILIASREEKELIQRLRSIQGLGDAAAKMNDATALSAEVITLKRQIADLQIDKSRIVEDNAKQERELRHMIGLEKRRQEVEIEQAKRDTSLTVREGNLAAEKQRFEEQLKFNTERFTTMETYLKDMMSDILERLPNVNVKLKGQVGG